LIMESSLNQKQESKTNESTEPEQPQESSLFQEDITFKELGVFSCWSFTNIKGL
jgi:hypothetical protein